MINNVKKDYVPDILTKLLKKYHKRLVAYGEKKINRRISLKVEEIYKNYKKNNADIIVKTQVQEAVKKLEQFQYISVEYLRYSDDVEKIFLNEEVVIEIEDYLEQNYGIEARYYQVEEIQKLISKYQQRGKLTAFYCGQLERMLENSAAELDVDKERELLKMLSFLQTNEEKMYIREASMLVYGTSKYFENNRRDAICNILRMEQGEAAAGDEIADEILQQYHVFPVEQEVCIKGNFTIVFEETTLETKGISGGISLSSKDIAGIKNIVVHTERIMTIENKTAFCRFEQENCSTIYLEGYANRSQIAFLKKLVENNPDKCYFHFGDIDAGGFLIHRNLCEATGQTFEMFHMGVPELKHERYKKCLAPLTANDKVRLQTLKDNEVYGECVQEMLHLNAKLEQEIVCYFLMKDK